MWTMNLFPLFPLTCLLYPEFTIFLQLVPQYTVIELTVNTNTCTHMPAWAPAFGGEWDNTDIFKIWVM